MRAGGRRGPQFATAWWLLIDANVLSHQHAGQTGESGFNGVILWWFYIPGVISTVALIMYDAALDVRKHGLIACTKTTRLHALTAVNVAGLTSSLPRCSRARAFWTTTR